MKRRMWPIIGLLLCGADLNAQKKPKPEPEPTKTYPTARTFRASCDALWPASLQVLAANGWSIKLSDRAGGLLTFDRTQSERMRSFKDFVSKYTTGKTTGFWTIYSGFRFSQSQAVMVPRAESCSLTLSLAYEVYGSVGAGSPTQWWSIPSNGSFEDKMLNEIESKVAAR